ncbi:alpha/beta hydrolase [Oculatella sp. LEGE 06141]|uniref:alpha/beta hydrolase n=1 Tax=Oculatella sp. LEGE 06141 TaxID=1828648 RepID=UPI001881CBE2|nr:alpha/beta hydrolase [Oculatella sp. LEGE 06141]MBE9178096.1 alpha/beta hydrolase [Oculatella sp. LEGE 06141]
MGGSELKESLPFTWKDEETCRTDQQWLGGIIHSAAPYSDWWTKTRIVQLAYEPMLGANPEVYAGKTTVADIVTTLYQELEAYCSAQQLSDCQSCYPGFFAAVDAGFVVTTLNSWKNKEFTQAIGRNFEVYSYDGSRVSRNDCKTFLIVSTASVSLSVERQLPPPNLFQPLFNVDELAQVIHDNDIESITVRTHGYGSPAQSFFASFAREATQLFSGQVNVETVASPEVAVESQSQPPTTLPPRHVYIGYHWPSEQPILNIGLVKDLIRNWGIVLKFLGSMFVLSLVPSLIFTGLYDLILPLQVRWYWVIPLVFFITWLLAFALLRALVYQRDRYRAIHYGAPDLAEFFWRLDKQLKDLQVASFKSAAFQVSERDIIPPTNRKRVNLVGHSMGGLVLVNMLRVISDRFGKDDRLTHERGAMGECLDLGKLVLASPDIPLELLREGRNNYVRSAIRRCEQIYLLSSDRDVVLRYLSTVGNWFSEPSVEMSGLRLGNVYLHRGQKLEEMLLIRSAIVSRQAVQPTSAYDLFESFNYLDCSRMVGVNAIGLSQQPATALVIDLVNIVFYLFGKIDVHGGYFLTHTPTFKLLPFLLQTITPSAAAVGQEISRLDTKKQILFLPSRPID